MGGGRPLTMNPRASGRYTLGLNRRPPASPAELGLVTDNSMTIYEHTVLVSSVSNLRSSSTSPLSLSIVCIGFVVELVIAIGSVEG